MLLSQAVNNIKSFSHKGSAAITTDQETSDILAAIKIAWDELCLLLPQQAFVQHSDVNGTNIATVAGTEVYSLSGNTYPVQELMIVRYIYQNVNYNMRKVESEQEFFGNVYYSQPTETRPYVYVPYGFDSSGNKQIRIFPVPDQVYNLIYSFYVDPTTVQFATSGLNSAIPFMPSYLQIALWKGGLYYYLKKFDSPQQQQAKMDYDQAKEMKIEAEESDQDGTGQMRFDTSKTRFCDPVTGIRLQQY